MGVSALRARESRARSIEDLAGKTSTLRLAIGVSCMRPFIVNRSERCYRSNCSDAAVRIYAQSHGEAMLSKKIKAVIRTIVVRFIPLPMRKVLAVIVEKQFYIRSSRRSSLEFQLLTDFAHKDNRAYHRFMWHHHLGYAESYVVSKRFGMEKMHITRRELFTDLFSVFEESDMSSVEQVRTVLDVGCSLGYTLQHMEERVFPRARALHGIDIDRQAVRQGSRHLRQQESKVKLQTGDLADLDTILAARKYDFVLASGVLLYFDEESAQRLVNDIVRHTNRVAAFTALAHAKFDNKYLTHSVLRERDRTWCHNLDRMIADAGGRVLGRRWEGARVVDYNTVYFVFAAPE